MSVAAEFDPPPWLNVPLSELPTVSEPTTLSALSDWESVTAPPLLPSTMSEGVASVLAALSNVTTTRLLVPLRSKTSSELPGGWPRDQFDAVLQLPLGPV